MIGGVVTNVGVADGDGDEDGVTVRVPVGEFEGVGVMVKVPVGVSWGAGDPVEILVAVRLGVTKESVPVGTGEAVGGKVPGVELVGSDVLSGGPGVASGPSGIDVTPG